MVLIWQTKRMFAAVMFERAGMGPALSEERLIKIKNISIHNRFYSIDTYKVSYFIQNSKPYI